MGSMNPTRLYSRFQRPIKFIFFLFIFWNFLFLVVFYKYLHKIHGNIFSAIPLGLKTIQFGFKVADDGTIYLPDGIVLHDGRNEDIKRFIKELNLTNPGEAGTPTWPDEKLLTEEHRKLIKAGQEEFGCNTLISDMVGLNRIIPDNRSDYCKAKTYDTSNYPKVSVVIAFHNDPWSVLLRTVHSILINTPPHLLEEIVLSDDYSTKDHLKKPLDDYLKTLKKVRVVRSHKRLGVLGARVLGYRNAIGPVIVSFDSHVEPVKGWLEPMLDRLKDNPTLAVWPKVHGSSGGDFGVWGYDDSVGQVGGLAFSMDFILVDGYPRDSNIPSYEPWKSPTLYGPCFAMWKDFFEKIGYLDYDFDIWGGDDVELGLKTWMCGGSVEMIPCGTVIHLYRDHTYSKETKGKGGYRWNTDRMAETWMDDNYKKYYYRSVGDTKNRNYGDISERLELKKKIGCKSFTWYVENVHPDLKKIPHWLSDEEWAKKEAKKTENDEKMKKVEEKKIEEKTKEIFEEAKKEKSEVKSEESEAEKGKNEMKENQNDDSEI